MTRIFIRTFGCSVNRSDSERMAGLLTKAKFELALSLEDSDLVIVNSCTVKQPTEGKVLSYIQKAEELGKPVIVAGCLSQATPALVAGRSLVGTNAIDEIVPIVEETLQGNVVELLAGTDCRRLELPKVRLNPAIEVLPISQGCLGECSYCIVRQARGRLLSYPKELIVASARQAVAEGVREIWLTAQDTGCYGQEAGTNLASLIQEIALIPGKFMIRVGMMNPDHALGFLDRLADAYQSPKVFKFLHVPVQSGSDTVLSAMKRKYSVADFVRIVDFMRSRVKNLTISTDMICGFPGETRIQLDESMELVKKIQPEVLNVSRFHARQGTQAAAMIQVPDQEIKDRSSRLVSAFQYIAFQENRRWIGWSGEVIVDERGTDGTWVGRNFAYRPVILEGPHQLGDTVRVRIVNSTIHDLRGTEL